jgi:hypothetical protein
MVKPTDDSLKENFVTLLQSIRDDAETILPKDKFEDISDLHALIQQKNIHIENSLQGKLQVSEFLELFFIYFSELMDANTKMKLERFAKVTAIQKSLDEYTGVLSRKNVRKS